MTNWQSFVNQVYDIIRTVTTYLLFSFSLLIVAALTRNKYLEYDGKIYVFDTPAAVAAVVWCVIWAAAVSFLLLILNPIGCRNTQKTGVHLAELVLQFVLMLAVMISSIILEVKQRNAGCRDDKILLSNAEMCVGATRVSSLGLSSGSLLAATVAWNSATLSFASRARTNRAEPGEQIAL